MFAYRHVISWLCSTSVEAGERAAFADVMTEGAAESSGWRTQLSSAWVRLPAATLTATHTWQRVDAICLPSMNAFTAALYSFH